MSKYRLVIATLLLSMIVSGAIAGERQDKSVMLILDASGSMWGEVNGKRKYKIARNVTNQLIGDWPSDLKLGLMAYGHRRKGDCGDIETLATPGPLKKNRYKEIVNRITPKGQTPLSDAVLRAAQALNYQQTPSSVILVSDGRESCGMDPCKIGAKLNEQGISFTAHIVGFDVRKKQQSGLRCLAENTGGSFYTAKNASQLTGALQKSLEKISKKKTMIQLMATDRKDGPAIKDRNFTWTLVSKKDGSTIFEGDKNSVVKREVQPGRYKATVRWKGKTTSDTFQVEKNQRKTVKLQLPFQATLKAPDKAKAGGTITVRWEGPDRDHDGLVFVPKDRPIGGGFKRFYSLESNPMVLRVPDDTGVNEIHYVNSRTYTILATKKVKVQSVDVSLEAPDSVGQGSIINVKWNGPGNRGDFITIVPNNASDGRTGAYRPKVRRGNPLPIRVPAKPGQYEIRYLSGADWKVLARSPIRVTKSKASLRVEKPVKVGSNFAVHWKGPNNRGDYITIVKRGAPESAFGPRRPKTRSGNPLYLFAPPKPGEYEIRYRLGVGSEVLAKEVIKTKDVSASLNPPKQVKAGQRFTVEWNGPAFEEDYITIVPKGAPNGAYGPERPRPRKGRPVTLVAPEKPGTYEIRYKLGGSRPIASTTIQVK